MPEHVRLISAGPSLAYTLPLALAEPDAVATVTVNRACEAVASDYWCFIDRIALQLFTPIGSPAYITNVAGRPMIPGQEGRIVDVDSIPGPPRGSRWPRKSGLVGLAWCIGLAASRGSSLVRCYGVDMDGTADFVGDKSYRGGRTAARWGEERRAWDLVCAWGLETYGVMVDRVIPAPVNAP